MNRAQEKGRQGKVEVSKNIRKISGNPHTRMNRIPADDKNQISKLITDIIAAEDSITRATQEAAALRQGMMALIREHFCEVDSRIELGFSALWARIEHSLNNGVDDVRSCRKELVSILANL